MAFITRLPTSALTSSTFVSASALTPAVASCFGLWYLRNFKRAQLEGTQPSTDWPVPLEEWHHVPGVHYAGEREPHEK